MTTDPERSESDRVRGVMPSQVARRTDYLELWSHFRRAVGNSWTGEKLDMFIAGWDARMKNIEQANATPKSKPQSDDT